VAPLFSARDSGLVDVWDPADAREVRLAAVARGFFLSSPDPPMEDVDLCDALDEVVGPVALLAGFRTVDPAMARVGGLLNPPVALADVEDAVGLVVEVVDEPAGPISKG